MPQPDQSLHLPFKIPDKEWFGPDEAGAVLGLSGRFIEKLYDAGLLSGHRHNGQGAEAGKRMTKKIPRAWLITYALRTADYDDPMLIEAFIACAGRLSPAARLKIGTAFTRAASA
jgi:hypothetical protein